MKTQTELNGPQKGPQTQMASNVEPPEEPLCLQVELERALKQANDTFKGNFYHAKLHPSAPNPCLSISGLGLISLPLGGEDAKRIISVASLSPFGHGERTVVDRNVRDTWEVDPANVSFLNTAWNEYVDTTVCKEVCTSLGVTITAPKMELYKLLLYETGSHFLPHQDTQKASGMFATVVVILPSAYEGGQLVVSHAFSTTTVDFAGNSATSTAVLAWYTDVRHEVKPITSGYRLALSYNLIHTSPQTGLYSESLPKAAEIYQSLSNIFRKWRQRLDRYEPIDENVIAYILDHEYSLANISGGPSFLKGADAQSFASIQPVAESFGFILGFATLEHHVKGPADDNGGGYHSRGRYYDEDSEEDDYGYGGDGDPAMMEVDERQTTLESMTGLDGKPLFGMTKSLTLDEEYLVPAEPFEKAKPDETEYEGYMGNGAGDIEYWYRRTVLVILNGSGIDQVRFDVEGVQLAFDTLKETFAIPPSTDNLKWVKRILQDIYNWSKEDLEVMLDYAIKWRSINLWDDSTKSSFCSLENIDVGILLEACQVFSFEAVRLSLEAILARSSSKHAQERSTLMQVLRQHVDATERASFESWSRRELQKILDSLNSSGAAQDCEAVIVVIELVGLRVFAEEMLPDLRTRIESFDFWLGLHRLLVEKRQTILDKVAEASQSENGTHCLGPPKNANGSEGVDSNNQRISLPTLLDDITASTLCVASQQWINAPLTPQAASYQRHHNIPEPHKAKVDRMLLIIEHCERGSYTDIRDKVLNEALNLPGLLIPNFSDFYSPLVPRLLAMLEKLGSNITSPPYSTFAQSLIGKHLAHLLGKKGHVVDCNLRKVGCGCADCGILDSFMLDVRQSDTVIRLNQMRRNHLEHRLYAARDLCTFEEVKTGNPHGLSVKKKQAVMLASNWDARLRGTKKFLGLFGSTDTLAAIMGGRYSAVQAALKGHQYVQLGAPAQTSDASTSRPTTRTATTPSTNTPIGISQASRQVGVGQKRKGAPLKDLGVIDLTGDD